MKVLHINKLYNPWIGGVERVVQDAAEGLKDDFAMTVLCCQSKGGAADEVVHGVRVIRAASFGMLWGMPLSFDFFKRFKELAVKHDVLHFYLPFPLAVAAFMRYRFRLGGKRIVVSYISDIIRQRIANPLLNPFTKMLLAAAQAIVVSSPALARNSPLLRNFSDAIHIVPFGVDAEHYDRTPAIAESAQRLRPFSGAPVVLFVGRLNYYKGVEYLIAAMPKVAHRALLWIVGGGPREKKLRGLAEHLGVGARVEFFGRVNDDVLKAFYHACDIFVLPSIYASEVFGLVQLEAMACGKPVVNTALPTGVPWVSQHEVTGLTVPPKDAGALADAINRLLKDDGLRRRLGEAARKRAEERFSMERFLDAHKRLYAELMQMKGSN